MLRALLPRFLLVFALLFAQLGGWTHGVAHTLEGHDAALSHDQHCGLCELYDQLGNAVGASTLSVAAPQSHPGCAVIFPRSYASPPCTAYPARAPPYSA